MVSTQPNLLSMSHNAKKTIIMEICSPKNYRVVWRILMTYSCREHGITQLINIFEAMKMRSCDKLLWGGVLFCNALNDIFLLYQYFRNILTYSFAWIYFIPIPSDAIFPLHSRALLRWNWVHHCKIWRPKSESDLESHCWRIPGKPQFDGRAFLENGGTLESAPIFSP